MPLGPVWLLCILLRRIRYVCVVFPLIENPATYTYVHTERTLSQHIYQYYATENDPRNQGIRNARPFISQDERQQQQQQKQQQQQQQQQLPCCALITQVKTQRYIYVRASQNHRITSKSHTDRHTEMGNNWLQLRVDLLLRVLDPSRHSR